MVARDAGDTSAFKQQFKQMFKQFKQKLAKSMISLNNNFNFCLNNFISPLNNVKYPLHLVLNTRSSSIEY